MLKRSALVVVVLASLMLTGCRFRFNEPGTYVPPCVVQSWPRHDCPPPEPPRPPDCPPGWHPIGFTPDYSAWDCVRD